MPGRFAIPVKGLKLLSQGDSAFLDYERTGRARELEAAVAAYRQALAVTPPRFMSHARCLSSIGMSLRARFELASDRADLDAAIDAETQAIAAISARHRDRAVYLSNLASSLLARFELVGDRADVDAAIDAETQAIAAISARARQRAAHLSNLGNFLATRFEHAGDRADLDAAIDAGQQAVNLAPPGHPSRPMCLTNLGSSLSTRFEQDGDRADLDAAINAEQQAVDLIGAQHPHRAAYLANLANRLVTRFEQDGNRADLDAAIDAGQEAVDRTGPGHPSHPRYLSNIGNYLLTRFEQDGDRADLDAAINAEQKAVALIGAQHPDRAGYLSNLGSRLDFRFELAGDPGDLDAAIDAAQQAVDLTPPGHPSLPRYLSNLGTSLSARFGQDRDRADLDAAISAGQQAVDLVGARHAHRAGLLSNLASRLHTRFEQDGDRADLDAAIDDDQQAVNLTGSGNPDRAGYLSNLASRLRTRFEQDGDRADLDAAIDAGRQAVDLTGSGNYQRAGCLSTLGVLLESRFKLAGDPADLDAAISAGQQAVSLTPPGHTSYPMYLSNVGRCLLARSELAGDRADLDAAIACWQKASQEQAGSARMRLAAARRWAQTAAGAGLKHQAADGYAAAVGLLPRVAWHGLDRTTREKLLAQWAGLAADAAASAVLDGSPERAVELLEQGRSVLWTQALNLRDDLSRLAEEAPRLAERLDSVRKMLDTPLPGATLLAPARTGSGWQEASLSRQWEHGTELRRAKAREWDDLLAQVRALDGFSHFLGTVPYVELAATASAGPVVIVNASSYGCHALVVDAASDKPRVVQLPDMNIHAAIEHANAMLWALAGAEAPGRAFPERDKDRRVILATLEWLWDVIAEPVLTALGHTSAPTPGRPWPRVWWCPTGPLIALPIHAAGRHPALRTRTVGTDSVPDRVISSYTPSLTALRRAQEPLAPASTRQLAVAMPVTPGQLPLPSAVSELEVLARHFPQGECHRQLVGAQATRASVAAAIPGHSWVHLACHARQEHADPSRSGFALWDGTLTIADLAALPTQSKELAFLSACETAAGSTRHLDEAIHLAAAMQFLGYRHVIATMWTMDGRPAAQIADTFYAALLQDSRAGSSRAAEALHQAIRSLRQADPTNPLIWASYVHLGP